MKKIVSKCGHILDMDMCNCGFQICRDKIVNYNKI
jgi:hypothetical protein